MRKVNLIFLNYFTLKNYSVELKFTSLFKAFIIEDL